MAVVNILAWVIVGGIAGWLASMVVQGTGMGVIGDIIVGIVGALIGGFVLSLLLPGTFGFTGFNFGSLVVAFFGAVILLSSSNSSRFVGLSHRRCWQECIRGEAKEAAIGMSRCDRDVAASLWAFSGSS